MFSRCLYWEKNNLPSEPYGTDRLIVVGGITMSHIFIESNECVVADAVSDEELVPIALIADTRYV